MLSNTSFVYLVFHKCKFQRVEFQLWFMKSFRFSFKDVWFYNDAKWILCKIEEVSVRCIKFLDKRDWIFLFLTTLFELKWEKLISNKSKSVSQKFSKTDWMENISKAYQTASNRSLIFLLICNIFQFNAPKKKKKVFSVHYLPFHVPRFLYDF